jgi:hypothetical protein
LVTVAKEKRVGPLRPGWRRIETWVCGGVASVTRHLLITHTPLYVHARVSIPSSPQEVRKSRQKVRWRGDREGQLEREAHERRKRARGPMW